MDEFTFQRLEKIRELGDRECPGEAACMRRKGQPIHDRLRAGFVQICRNEEEVADQLRIWQENPDPDFIDGVCGECDLLPTKPGGETPFIAAALNTVNDYEKLHRIGVQFTLDDVMTGRLPARVINAVYGVQLGRDRAEKARQDAMKAEHERTQAANASARQQKPHHSPQRGRMD